MHTPIGRDRPGPRRSSKVPRPGASGPSRSRISSRWPARGSWERSRVTGWRWATGPCSTSWRSTRVAGWTGRRP